MILKVSVSHFLLLPSFLPSRPPPYREDPEETGHKGFEENVGHVPVEGREGGREGGRKGVGEEVQREVRYLHRITAR